MALILASSSAFRKQQLAILGLHPQCVAPNIDETEESATSPEQLAELLSVKKALAMVDKFPNDLIIGSDQVAWFNGKQVHKPLTEEKARQQLQAFSGKPLQFFSGLALHDSKNNMTRVGHTVTDVIFRDLTLEEINAVVRRDQPLFCAGSFKIEQLGILLFETVQSIDPSALVGLPLILLNTFLREAGFNCLLDDGVEMQQSD